MSEEATARARERVRTILRAEKLATFDAWTLAVFGAGSLLFAVTSLTALVVGVALLALAWVAFRGRARLRRLEPGGADLLGWNQVALFALLAAYCLWSVWTLRAGLPEELDGVVALAGIPPDLLLRLLRWSYGAVIVLSLVLQGLAAWYYWSRGRLLREHLERTPDRIPESPRDAAPGLPGEGEAG